ncbi:NAD(+)/NADH kinase [Microbacterium sp. CFH 31415]|uniref:diacylglycerol/lipid kinase family protein n=1 Tax=Microbacterium sp. CFH 31415 TaxID=2921732 RepID=UPI001F1451E8|nr:diacylglycerol kinase family protein [Microbacterium sp. CFH 31415]MCH6231517.1 NAD(+)/NADH kinase [Microbacterium sp. CFH 31415]
MVTPPDSERAAEPGGEDAPDPVHPSDAIYADGPDRDEVEADAERVAEAAAEGAGDARPADADAPDPAAAAAPDDVIREPEDVEPDTKDGEGGEARRVGPEGETEPMAGGDERPSPKAALVYNPIKADGDALRETLMRLSAEAGWAEPLFYETTVDDLGDDVTRQALEAGVDAVLVAGGDGTVRAVSEAMSGSGVRLAIVPSGTGNLLARNLRLPLTEPEAMMRAVFDGDTLAMDIGWSKLQRRDGEIEERAFVVMGGIGLDAAMIANTNPQLKKTVGWVAYVDGAARSLPSAKPFRVMYQLPEARLHSARVQSILFANCGSLPAGLELIPEASVADGALDIVIFQPKGPLGWIFVWRRVAWDNSFLRRFRAGRRVLALRTKDNAVRYSRGSGIEIATQDPRPVQLDGDEFGEAVSVRTRVEPGALLMVVPKNHETDAL